MSRVSQSEITTQIASDLGLPPDQTKNVVTKFLLDVQDHLLAGKRVILSGFVTLGTRRRNARKGRNPRTGEAVRVPAGRKLFMKTSTSLKRDLNSSKKARTRTRLTAAGAKKKAPAKKKAAPKKVAKKAPAKKAPAKKAPAKKAPAKKVARKAPAKKTARKAVRKTVAKKAPAKRRAVKKAPAKKRSRR